MTPALAGQVGEQLRREQLVAMISEKGMHRPVRDQVAAPGRRVQLGIEGVGLGAHAGESARYTIPVRNH
jgi:hypothetical protein